MWEGGPETDGAPAQCQLPSPIWRNENTQLPQSTAGCGGGWGECTQPWCCFLKAVRITLRLGGSVG